MPVFFVYSALKTVQRYIFVPVWQGRLLLYLLIFNIYYLYLPISFMRVRPPLVEYVDSLLTGTGGDLDLRTFKIVDQVTGKTMGIRADMTPQVARIDAHILNRSGVSRLCYVGSVLHARPLHPLASRQPR